MLTNDNRVISGTYQNCLLAILNPSLSGKIGGFCTVETVVETGMICIGERDHELPSLLSNLKGTKKTISNCSSYI